MTTYVFVFVPTEKTPEDFRERLRDCVASLPDVPLPAVEENHAQTDPAPQPFWTMFLPNPLPTPKS